MTAGLAADMHHGPRRLQESRFSDVMARFLSLNYTVYVCAEFRVGFTGPHSAIKAVFHL